LQVVAAVPSAIGALCLNQAGLDQLANRPTIIPQMFSILTSDRHVKTLQDKDNATYLGAAMDELIRHHPSLKEAVFSAIKGVMQRIEELGNAYPIPIAEAANYGLRAIPSDQDVEMEESIGARPTEEGDTAVSTSTESDAYVPTRKPEDLDASAQAEDASPAHPIIIYIEIACRVRMVAEY
jgi:E3 ubiquitin-protein ligase HUWE1